MKSITATMILLFLIYLSTQVASLEGRDYYYSREYQSSKGAVLRALNAVKFGLNTLRMEENHIKNAIRLESLGFVRANRKNCNFTDIESNFAQLVEVTVDFATDTASSLEGIFDLTTICANTSFPKSISCFLNLMKNCQPDIDAIKEALQEFTPQAQSLANNILLDVSKCYHW